MTFEDRGQELLGKRIERMAKKVVLRKLIIIVRYKSNKNAQSLGIIPSLTAP
jgi:hypothetical protein